MHRHAICHVIALLMATLLPSFARAERAEDEAQAEVLFNEGLQVMDRGRIFEACGKFEASMRLSPTSGTALALGNCYEMIGRTASAFGTFAEAIRRADAENRPRHHDAALKRKDALAPRLRTLAIRLAPGLKAAGVLVRIDGQRLEDAALGQERPLDPGEHLIEATADGYDPFREKVSMGDASISYTLRMEETAPPPPPEPAAPPPAPAPAPPPPPPPVVVAEPARTLDVRLHEDSSGPVRVTVETEKGDRDCPSFVSRDTACKLRNLAGEEGVIHVRYKGAKLDKVIDLRPGTSTVQVITGDSANSALMSLGVLGLLGGVGTGVAALVVSSSASDSEPFDGHRSGPSPKTLATIAAVSGGTGLLFMLLGHAASSPYIKVMGPRSADRTARAPRIRPTLDWRIGSSRSNPDAASRVSVGMGFTF